MSNKHFIKSSLAIADGDQHPQLIDVTSRAQVESHAGDCVGIILFDIYYRYNRVVISRTIRRTRASLSFCEKEARVSLVSRTFFNDSCSAARRVYNLASIASLVSEYAFSRSPHSFVYTWCMARLHYISSYVIHTSLCPLCSFYLITRLYSGNTQRNTDVKCLVLNHLIAMKPIIIEYKLIHNFFPISDGIACFRWIDKEPNLATFHVKGISACILCLSIDFICRREQYCNHWKLRGKKSAIMINLCVLCSLDCDKRDNKNRDSRENYRLHLEMWIL